MRVFFFLLLKETQGTGKLRKAQTILLTPVCLTHIPAPRCSICVRWWSWGGDTFPGLGTYRSQSHIQLVFLSTWMK